MWYILYSFAEFWNAPVLLSITFWVFVLECDAFFGRDAIRWGSRSSSLSVIITHRSSYMVVDCCWPPSFSGRRFSCLERNYYATSRLHRPCEFSAIIWRLVFSAVLFVVPACDVTPSLSDTAIASYIFTYLLTGGTRTFLTGQRDLVEGMHAW